MVKPNESQSILLESLRDFVIEVMLSMNVWEDYDLDPLKYIQLGLLRKNATMKHGVTKWPKGVTIDDASIHNIATIEIHPELLAQEWSAYAAFVLHHEFVHALGYKSHDSSFRKKERSWPGKGVIDMAPKFTEYLARKSANWMWVCTGCNMKIPKKNKNNGRYKCRKCLSTLVDVKV